MKRYFALLTILSVGIVACQEKENVDGSTPEAGTSYTLEGTVSADGFTWKAGAGLSLFSATDGVRIQNAQCSIEDGVGQATATFTTPGIDLIAGENKLALLYPYTSTALYTSERFSNLTLSDQTIAAPGEAADYIAAGYATGTPGTDATFGFELTPVTAVAEVRIGTSMSEYTGATIDKVSIQNSASIAIAGMYIINAGSDIELQPADQNTSISVGVTVTAPEALASGTVQSIPVTLFPADFTGEELNVMVDLTGDDGTAQTLTFKISDLVFEAGQTTVVDLSNFTISDITSEEWYCSDDTRLLPGMAYAYGQANTFIIQCKSGNTYTGGIYSPNSDIPDEVTIDYRIRGDRSVITDDLIPENVTFEWFTKTYDGSLYTPRNQYFTETGITLGESSFSITHDPDNYTVTVKNNETVAGAPILVMKKNGNILWAWSFWNVAADGTTLDPVTVGSYQFAPMDLGQPTTNTAWTTGGYPMYAMNLLYQWGRPYPVYWTTYWSLDTAESQGNVPTVYGPLSLETSVSTVGYIYSEDSSVTSWCTTSISDFWGTSDAEEDGSKTIYDPCPKGWKVATVPAMTALANGTPSFNSETANAYWVTVNGVLLYNNGYVTGTHYANGRPMNMQFAGNSNRGWLWTNVAGDEQGQTLFWASPAYSDEPEVVRLGSNNLNCLMSVRCIVDTDNR